MPPNTNITTITLSGNIGQSHGQSASTSTMITINVQEAMVTS